MPLPLARWGRSLRLLALPPGSQVLDVGCAFGYGTALLAARYRVQGVDSAERDIARAQRAYPHIPFQVASATALPLATASMDGVVLLDVLEHLPSGQEAAALREIARVLRPGGVVVLSVPHWGRLATLDALNVYTRTAGADSTLAALYAISGQPPHHRHYTIPGLAALLRPAFTIEQTGQTGTGLAEVVHLALLRGLWANRALRPLYQPALLLYYTAYILDDLWHWRRGYHLTMRARRNASPL